MSDHKDSGGWSVCRLSRAWETILRGESGIGPVTRFDVSASLLVILSPLVCFLLGSLALLGVLTAIFWKLLGTPHFPFGPALAASIGCGLAVVGYDAFPRTMSR
ncbi:MAG: hypothetical protein ACRDQZ_19715 [Mycobacteriales bacterium]